MIEIELFEANWRLAGSLATLLEQTNTRIVFAESCTAGLVSALLAGVPGISNWLCGSAATYREDTKRRWLDIGLPMIEQYTAVSPEVTRAMAVGVLSKTPEANVSVAITGHLELGVAKNPGVCFIVGAKQDESCRLGAVKEQELVGDSRITRQWEAAGFVIRYALEYVSNSK